MRDPIRLGLFLAALLLAGTTYPAFAEITLTSDKPVYVTGEIVHLTAHNAGPADEEFVSSPVFVIFNTDTDECVWGCAGLPVLTPFVAGETVTMDWDTGFVPDEPGNYAVGLAVSGSPTTTYTLIAGVGSIPTAWGTVKARYHKRAE